MKIVQYTPSLAKYDAVSDNVREIDKFISNLGVDSFIAVDARNVDDSENVKFAKELLFDEDDLLIIHFSISTAWHYEIKNIICKKILIYHNVTPSKFFVGISEGLVHATRLAREQLNEIKNYIDFAFGDSQYNAAELKSMGYKDVSVLPLYYDVTNKMSQSIRESSDQKLFIFVGRIVPNKRQEDLVKAFYFYHKYFNSNSKLKIIGGFKGMENYAEHVSNLIAELGLNESVQLTGKIEDSELQDAYRNASLFLSMSEHEGFSAPVLEAMACGLPILAYYNSGAIPETAGSGAIYFKRKDFFRVAAMMDTIVSDEELSDQIRKLQKQELERFNVDRLEQKLKNMLERYI